MSLFFYCVIFCLVSGHQVPPNSMELQQILNDAGYANWAEADKFLRTQMTPSLPQFVREFWTLMKHKGAMWNCSEPGPKPPKLQFFFTPNDAVFFSLTLIASCLLVQLRMRVSPLITVSSGILVWYWKDFCLHMYSHFTRKETLHWSVHWKWRAKPARRIIVLNIAFAIQK